MAGGLVVVGGVAYALTFTCEPGSTNENPCVGTEDADKITGTSGVDRIVPAEGRDTVFALAGDDSVDGFTGNDVIYGGPGNDATPALIGAENSDTVYGGDGNDIIDAAFADVPSPSGTRDRSYGEAGDDQIHARDLNKDFVNCGDGQDTVQGFDADLDTLKNCEIF
jgi:Ca2+-binding RTX toxin-like protein